MSAHKKKVPPLGRSATLGLSDDLGVAAGAICRAAAPRSCVRSVAISWSSSGCGALPRAAPRVSVSVRSLALGSAVVLDASNSKGSAGRPFRVQVCLDMCLAMFLDMCLDMCLAMCVDMCLDMCLDMFFRHVFRHVFRRVFRHVFWTCVHACAYTYF